MAKIIVNTQGKRMFPYLNGTPLTVFGYNPDHNTFICWDWCVGGWIEIPLNACEEWEDK